MAFLSLKSSTNEKWIKEWIKESKTPETNHKNMLLSQ